MTPLQSEACHVASGRINSPSQYVGGARPSMRAGFTLTELLVVMVIMTILLGVGGLSLVQDGSGRKMESALTVLESLVHEARSTAKAKGTTTRLLINDDASDPDNYRRQIIIASFDVANTAWVASSRAVTLPEEIYIDDTLNVPNLVGQLGVIMTNPGDVAFTKNVTPPTIYLEFNSMGICAHPAPAGAAAGAVAPIPGGTICLAKAALSPAGTLIHKQAANGSSFYTGIVVWRNGTTSRINDVTQITQISQP